jgi:hypothetical protein
MGGNAAHLLLSTDRLQAPYGRLPAIMLREPLDAPCGSVGWTSLRRRIIHWVGQPRTVRRSSGIEELQAPTDQLHAFSNARLAL